MKIFYLGALIIMLLSACSGVRRPDIPDQDALLIELSGSSVSNGVNRKWKFEEGQEYISFQIKDQKVFDDEAELNVRAIGIRMDSYLCTVMNFKVNLKIDNDNRWRVIGRPRIENFDDIKNFPLESADCQGS